ncbi:hypothetical protein MRX96_018251 [Rhipicephalus microplus]
MSRPFLLSEHCTQRSLCGATPPRAGYSPPPISFFLHRAKARTCRAWTVASRSSRARAGRSASSISRIPQPGRGSEGERGCVAEREGEKQLRRARPCFGTAPSSWRRGCAHALWRQERTSGRGEEERGEIDSGAAPRVGHSALFGLHRVRSTASLRWLGAVPRRRGQDKRRAKKTRRRALGRKKTAPPWRGARGLETERRRQAVAACLFGRRHLLPRP